jgi:branched-subunit amino acid aminotransferase/4-amino-4-deoxychorismate lyase
VSEPGDGPPWPAGAAWIDGRYRPVEDARISVLDLGVTRSDCTYDVVHVWEGRFYRRWLDLDLALLDAYDHDADLVVLRDLSGAVAEGPGYNVFAHLDGRWLTPGRGTLTGRSGARMGGAAEAEGFQPPRWRRNQSRAAPLEASKPTV